MTDSILDEVGRPLFRSSNFDSIQEKAIYTQYVTGVSTWPRSESLTKLLPPHHHSQVGRPKKKRKISAVEKINKPMVQGGRLSRAGKTVTCSRCKQKGHNSLTCKGQRAVPAKKKYAKQKKAAQSGQRNDGEGSQGVNTQGTQSGIGASQVTQARVGEGRQDGAGLGTQGSQVGVGTSTVRLGSPKKTAKKK